MRKNVADPRAALAMLFEGERRFEQVAGARGKDARLGEGKRFAVVPLEERFVIERIDLRGTAVHEEKNHSFGARREVRRSGREGIAGDAVLASVRPFGAVQQGRQRQTAKPGRRLTQPVAPTQYRLKLSAGAIRH